MSISRCCLLVFGFIIIAADRSPAPIREESPTPKPKVVAKKKADDEEGGKSQGHSKSKQSPFEKFTGVWTGNTIGSFTSDIGLNVGPTTSMTTLRVSNDGTVQFNQQSFRPSLSPDGRTLTWPYLYADSNGSGRGGASLRLIDQKTAQYQCSVVIAVAGGGGNATMKGSGILTK
jgi:hypothetical protein